jgi:GrpB-like predicted nucleotidyltransferase (UPF0157 family)
LINQRYILWFGQAAIKIITTMQYITPYNPDWPHRFNRIASHLAPFLPTMCQIHHVGSTSISGMPAKDIIDLDIECPHGAIPLVIAALAGAGYKHEGDKGIPGREAFRPLPDSGASHLPAHHLYACERGAEALIKHLVFRDYLTSHPERARWLAAKKIAVDNTAPTRDAYIEAKGDCYALISAESLLWADQTLGKTR